MNLRVKIDVTKLDKTAFFKGAKGVYCDLVLWENDGTDEYGNTHAVKQDMGKERRGEKTPYVGNAKPFGTAKAAPIADRPVQHSLPPQPPDVPDEGEDDADFIPF